MDQAIAANRNDGAMSNSSTRYTEDIRKAPEAEMVCYCAQVTKAQILSAVAAGARSLGEIKAVTGACTQERCREVSPRRR